MVKDLYFKIRTPIEHVVVVNLFLFKDVKLY